MFIIKNGKNKCIHYGEIYTLYQPVIKEVISRTNAEGKILSKKGDVLVPSTTTADALGIAVARSLNEDGVILGGDINIIRTGNEYVLSDYLAYLISNSKVKNQLAIFAKGVNILHLSNNDLRKIKIPLPPIEVQKEIVEQIEVKQKAIEAAKAVIDNLERERRYFGQSLRKIKDVEWVELSELYEIERGGSPRPIQKYLTEKDNGINWIKIGDTKNISKYISKTEEKIIPEGAKKSKMVYEGDFILSNSMSFGRPYIMKTTGCIHDGWLLLRAKSKKVDQDFLYYTLASEYIYEQFEKAATGGVVKNLNIGLVKKVKIPIPSLETQKQLVAEMEEQEKIIEANKKLVGIMEQKITEVLSEI